MGRKKASGGEGLAVVALIIIGLIIQYWKVILAVSVCCGILYQLYKILTERQASQKVSPEVITKEGIQELVRIQVTSESRPQNKATKENVRFYETSDMINLGSISVPAYLLYVGQSKKEYPHLVNPKLQIGTPHPELNAQMGYWPSYSSISPLDRATYLTWLASGRSNPRANIGLVFLYFYGLEFRAIQEGQNHKEIFHELVRLFKIYSSKNASFANYCGEFINWIVLKNESWPTSEFRELLTFLEQEPTQGCTFREITVTISSEMPINERASLLLLSHTKIIIPKKIQHDKSALFESFRKRIASLNLTQLGFTEQPATLNYGTASALRLQAKATYTLKMLDGHSYRALYLAWDTCLKEFSTYSTIKNSNSELAQLFVPATDVQKDGNANEKIKEWLSFQDSKICEMSEIVSLLNMSVGENLTTSEAKMLATGLERFDVSIEPDARITNKGLKSSEKVILIKRDLSEIDSNKWNKCINLFDLAMAVAIGDGEADEKEVSHTLNFVIRQFDLTQIEATRLTYRAGLLKGAKLSVSTLAKKIALTMTMNQGEAIAKFLFSIAALDGKIESGEMLTLEKTYKAFNFSPDILDRLIAEFTAENNGNNLVVLKPAAGKKSRKGSEIPSKQAAGEYKPIVLNHEALQKAFGEAAAVSKILASVFADQDKDTESAKTQTQNIPIPNGKAALSDLENKVLQTLFTKTSWNISEVEELCRKSNIMYGAFLNKVNNYFEDANGSTVLEEDGETLCINTKQLPEVESA